MFEHTKKVLSHNPGPVDFVVGLVDYVLHFPSMAREVQKEMQIFWGASDNDFWSVTSNLQLAKGQAANLSLSVPFAQTNQDIQICTCC